MLFSKLASFATNRASIRMVHYKLTYFDFCGRGEVIRQIFALADQKFEDNRIKVADWPAMKNSMLFGQMPVFEEDGQKLAQSHAIARYLARKFGLAGNSPWEEAQVDSIGDQFMDFIVELRPYLRSSKGWPETRDHDVLFKEVFVPGTKKHFVYFKQFLNATNTGFLVGSSVTWVDLQVAEWLSMFHRNNPELFEGFPELVTHFEKVHSIPAIKKWRAERPPSDY